MTFHNYRARWILPVAGPPIRDGILTIHDGRIVKLGSRADGAITDLGDAVITPGLVNAHTHLEFSELQEPLGTSAMPFTDWIKRVVAWRRGRDEGWDRAEGASPRHLAAVQAGIRESLQAGTTVLGEIATAAESATQLEQRSVPGIAFWEVIGWSESSFSSLMQATVHFVMASPTSSSVRRGVSPHAPYTVHQQLLRWLVGESASGHFPIAMHLAETEAELQLLASGTGPFAEMLAELQAWEPAAVIDRSRPLDYLQVLAGAERALIIHGNYLNDGEIEFLGRERDHMSVVYCPRTHSYFGHQNYPVEKMLNAGVRLALGTDSRASNPDLSLWNEVRFAARRHPSIAPETWLRIATWHGAEALGMDRDYGSLLPGKVGNFLVIPLSRDDPWSWLYEDGREPRIFTNRHY